MQHRKSLAIQASIAERYRIVRKPRTITPSSFPTVSRRQLIATSGAFSVAGLAGFLSFTSSPAMAQDQGPREPTQLGSPFPEDISQHASEWPLVHGDYKAHRNAESSMIDMESIDDLTLAWRLPLAGVGFYGAITSPALIMGDTVYFQDMQSNVFAVDRASGELKWQRVYDAMSFGPGGVSAGYGMIFGSTATQGEIFALNAETGEEIWKSKLSITDDGASVMAPTIYDNTVYISLHQGYRGGSRGFLYALDAGTGDVLWQWDTSTEDLWSSPRLNAGANIWYPASVDDEGNIYFGTGNPSAFPGDNGATRPGPNLYSSSMVSLDTTTGGVRWYVQAAPHDVLDHDFQQTPILATIPVEGTETQIAIGSGKTGTVIAADANSGDIVWEKKVGEHNEYGDATTPLPATPVTVLPGTYGGVESPMALADDTLFVPTLNLPSRFSATEWEVPEGQSLADASSELIALDVTDGSVKWEVTIETFVATGATVTNDIVFVGGLDGIVHGYDTSTGEEVWTYQAEGGLNAPFSAADDTLFVPVGSPLYTKAGDDAPPRMELLAFGLGGHESGTAVELPPVPSEDAIAATPADESAETSTEATAVQDEAVDTVTVEMVDIAFEPNAFTISADTPTRIELPNTGALPHDFTIDKLDIHVDVAPGESSEVTINAPAGTYEYYCSVPGHKEAGMVGVMTVE